MKNISFANPYFLLVFIPLAALLLIPYFISRSKDNKTLGWKISLGIHLVISALASLALAGLMATSVLTRTTVYVVADVSYSSERNLDEIDEYIVALEKKLPTNSKLGVVCFGKNVVLLTREGKALKSVSQAKVDDSGTDISRALEYAGTLFKGDSIKRIVLITDGNDTVSRDTGAIASTVERLVEADIKVDAVFLDNKVGEGEAEVQLSNAEYTSSVFRDHDNEVKLLVQASTDVNMIVRLERRPYGETETAFEEISYVTVTAEAGFNTVRMPLPSDEAGVFEYNASVEAENDFSDRNNAVKFVQTVEEELRVLLVSGSEADCKSVEKTYAEYASVDAYVVNGRNNRVPFTLEALTVYDEIVLSNVDVREIANANAFVDSLDIVVSQYGKSLVAIGDISLQNDKDDPVYTKLAEMMPVRYGSANKDGRLYTIVLDVSHSMYMATKFTIAKEAAIKLLSVLEDDDYVCLVTFSGEIKSTPVDKVKRCKNDLIEYINKLTTSHATDIGGGLNKALEVISANERVGQVMLISDGLSVDNRYDALEITQNLADVGVVISAIDVYIPSTDPKGDGLATMKAIAAKAGGRFYQISDVKNVDSLVYGDVAEEVTDAVVRRDSTVYIENLKDSVVDGFTSFPKVSAFVKTAKKDDAVAPITIDYPQAIKKTVPLYAYRQHGNGKVSSWTSAASNGWTALWGEELQSRFIENVLTCNTPKAKIDYPFNLKVENNDYQAYVEITPSILMPDATVTARLVMPNGRTTKKELAFDSEKFFYTFDTGVVGTYSLSITYQYDDKTYTAESYFTIPYLPEYNAFTNFDSAKIYDFMRGNGSICINELPDLTNDESEVATYKVHYRIPLLIAAVVLFVLDVAIRKFKLSDRRVGKARKQLKKGGAE